MLSPILRRRYTFDPFKGFYHRSGMVIAGKGSGVLNGHILRQQLLGVLDTAIMNIVKDAPSGIPFVYLRKPGGTHMKMLGNLTGGKVLVCIIALNIIPDFCRNRSFLWFFLGRA